VGAWLGVLGLLGLLALQVLWFQRGALAGDARWREPWLRVCAAVAPVLDCGLPDYVNLGEIRTRDLVVRSHPTAQRALVVDAVIANEGRYPQPFPDLALEFTDISGTPVAGRRFKPFEYLAGEMAGLRDIPAHTEVRLAIEIVDPGEAAIGYALHAVTR
jgi:hypothetical protein